MTILVPTVSASTRVFDALTSAFTRVFDALTSAFTRVFDALKPGQVTGGKDRHRALPIAANPDAQISQ
jgi:hypothetical protein